MYKRIEPKKQRHAPPKKDMAYVRVTPRLVYISNAAMKLMGADTESVTIGIDSPNRVMKISPGGQWKLSTVCETRNARRIENGSTVMEIIKGGFPMGMMGKYLHVQQDMVGSLIVSLIPDYDAA